MKMCAVGDYDSICGFSSLGIETFEIGDETDIGEKILSLSKGDYVIILITENAALKARDVIEKFKTQKVPAIIPIPSVTGSTGFGMSNLRTAVERAVGSAEMIFGSEN